MHYDITRFQIENVELQDLAPLPESLLRDETDGRPCSWRSQRKGRMLGVRAISSDQSCSQRAAPPPRIRGI